VKLKQSELKEMQKSNDLVSNFYQKTIYEDFKKLFLFLFFVGQ